MKKICPKCSVNLVAGKPRSYETLVEHVSDPNMYWEKQAPLRGTLVCPRNCYPETYWSVFGESYSNPSWLRRMAWKITDYRWPSFPKSAPELYETDSGATANTN